MPKEMNDIRVSAPESRPKAKEVCAFLAEYSGWLFSSGATCIRLEKNVKRIAASLGMTVEMSVLPRHLHITVMDRCGRQCFTSVAPILERPVSFAINTRLSTLSWDMADGEVDFREAQKRFCRIIDTPLSSGWAVLMLVAIANASFCRLFGGDMMAMAVVFIATAAGFALKQTLTEKHVDSRLVVIACSFVSAVLAAADGLFSLGRTPEIAIGTSVLYLVPGIPYINSFCDMLDRHYICAFGRAMNAVVITCCLSIGLCAGMLLMNVGMF